ncbi:MAG: c-type cytochrome biogenesis protein CcsB [Actinomycetota bacterium]|nr:c-type cytochrome biogenesis protein CcsB [Actinomycetota bacterium]
MSHDSFEVLSNQAVAACAVVYFLAVLAHLAQWAVGRKVPVTASATSSAGTAASQGGMLVRTDPPPSSADAERMELFARVGVALTIVAAFVHGIAVVSRGLAANPVRVPWGNMYEFTLTGTWFVVMGYLVLYRRYRLGWLAPVVTSFVLVTLMVDVLLLYMPVTPLRDALQSPWLVIHVVAALLATGAFTIGGMCSALFLIKQRWLSNGGSEEGSGYLARLPGLDGLDRMAYRVHAFGFPIWTFAALIAGPIWAQHAWGRYWGWDPKEIWAFITWVVYAAYLHARATAGWRGRAAAMVALVGLATLWFNFIGINFFFGSGSQHSYAVAVITSRL